MALNWVTKSVPYLLYSMWMFNFFLVATLRFELSINYVFPAGSCYYMSVSSFYVLHVFLVLFPVLLGLFMISVQSNSHLSGETVLYCSISLLLWLSAVISFAVFLSAELAGKGAILDLLCGFIASIQGDHGASFYLRFVVKVIIFAVENYQRFSIFLRISCYWFLLMLGSESSFPPNGYGWHTLARFIVPEGCSFASFFKFPGLVLYKSWCPHAQQECVTLDILLPPVGSPLWVSYNLSSIFIFSTKAWLILHWESDVKTVIPSVVSSKINSSRRKALHELTYSLLKSSPCAEKTAADLWLVGTISY